MSQETTPPTEISPSVIRDLIGQITNEELRQAFMTLFEDAFGRAFASAASNSGDYEMQQAYKRFLIKQFRTYQTLVSLLRNFNPEST